MYFGGFVFNLIQTIQRKKGEYTKIVSMFKKPIIVMWGSADQKHHVLANNIKKQKKEI